MITERFTLAELGEIFDGPHATPKRQTDGPYFLNIASLVDGRLDLTQSDHVSRDDFERWTRRVTPQEGDLLFSYETRLGDAALMPAGIEACLGRRMALLRPNRERVDPRYLLYLYLSPAVRQIIDRHTIHGATVNRIGLSTMGSWTVDVPALSEQRAVAEVLGALDEKIAVNAKLVANVTDISRLLLAGETPTSPLSAIVAHNKKSVSPQQFPGKVLHYSLPAFDAGQRPEPTDAVNVKSSKFLVEKPCVLVSKLNPRFPRVWDVPGVADRTSLASTEFLVLESKYSASSVLWVILSQPSFGAALEAKVAGTSGSHQRVRPADLLTTEVVDPRTLSARLQDQLTSLGQCRKMYREENIVLEATRDALLPQLMSGKIRVKDAEKRVEEVL